MVKKILKPSIEFSLPALFSSSSSETNRIVEFFVARIRNPNTRKVYARATFEFAKWCTQHQIHSLHEVRSIHVATYLEQLKLSTPSKKVSLAALRMLFDWLVTGQIIPINPAVSVRGPKYTLKKGKTPILTADEARALLSSIQTDTLAGLRDRALIGLMLYTFARVGAVTKMRKEDIFIQGRRVWVRLHEKGGKLHEMPCNHVLEEYLLEYLDKANPADKDFLFRSIVAKKKSHSENPLSQADVYRMIRRRAMQVGITTKIGAHTFRATGITQYLRNGGKLEIAQLMANHESSRTTSLYDRRADDVTLSEVERIMI